MAARKDAELIKAWADGAMIQRYRSSDDQWIDAPIPSWDTLSKYRIKPAEPERVYPVTGMTKKELENMFWSYDVDEAETCIVIANAALRHAVDAGQVVTREEFDRMCGDRKARDLAVAKAAIKRINLWLDNDRRLSGLPRIQIDSGDADIACILAEVKP